MNLKGKFILVCFLIILFFNDTATAQLMSVESKDSLNGKPRITARLLGRLKLNGTYDIKGSLAGLSAFLIHENNVDGTDIPAFNMDMRQSQLRFMNTTQLGNGKELKAMLEGDFDGPSNTSLFRLRHAFITYDHWMIGQNWSTFGDASLWPAALLDWDGPTGMVLSRRIQIRYTGYFKKGSPTAYEIALEYMEPRRSHDYTTNTNYGIDYAPVRAPDVVGAIRHLFENEGFIKIAGLYRSIGYKSADIALGETNFKFDSKSGGGVSALTSIFFEKKSGLINNLQAQWSAGKGIASYFLAVGGSGLDGFASSNRNGELELLPVHAGFISYERYFTKKFHAMVMTSYNHFYDGENTQAGWNTMTNYQATLNVSYNFLNYLMVGVEPQIGYKELEYNDGTTQGANAIRINFGMLFNF